MSGDHSITDYRWDGWTDDDLADAIDRLNGGPGAEALTPALDALTAVAKSLYHIDATLHDQLGTIGINWQTPQSSDLAEQVMAKARQYGGDAERQGTASAAAVEAQTAAFIAARNAMPPSSALRSTTGPSYLFGMHGQGTYATPSLTAHGESDASRVAARHREARDQAVDAWSGYNRNSSCNLSAQQSLPPPPPVGVHGGYGGGCPAGDPSMPIPAGTAVASAAPPAVTLGGDAPAGEGYVGDRAGSASGPSIPLPGGYSGGLAGGCPEKGPEKYPERDSGMGPGQRSGKGPGMSPGIDPGSGSGNGPGNDRGAGGGGFGATGASPDRGGAGVARIPGGSLGGAPGGESSGTGGQVSSGKTTGVCPVPVGEQPPDRMAGANPQGVTVNSAVNDAAVGSAIAAGAGAAGVAGFNAEPDRVDRARRGPGGIVEEDELDHQRLAFTEPEEDAARARASAGVAAEPEESASMLEPAAGSQGEQDGERIRRYGVDDQDLFADNRMVSDSVLGDGGRRTHD